jgi:hypothetical protein
MFDSEVAHPAANKSAGSTASSAHQSGWAQVPSHSVAALICEYLRRLSQLFLIRAK